MEAFDTLLEGINELKKQGYTEDFNLKQNCLECRNGEYKVFHDEFEIDNYFRFEGDSNPDDSSILYAISSDKYQLKGIMVNSYGIYSEEIADEMLDKLKTHKKTSL
ncbi:phosphoribosylpyrophosphate synthetase [Tenacibaculum sp. TC6]|uniref:phosphoribosylpyrophosphate synthetase n=1 Tax=Tenacibaculum sp. TC6 TaxID=3423223 RepID=UPI003D365C01